MVSLARRNRRRGCGLDRRHLDARLAARRMRERERRSRDPGEVRRRGLAIARVDRGIRAPAHGRDCPPQGPAPSDAGLSRRWSLLLVHGGNPLPGRAQRAGEINPRRHWHPDCLDLYLVATRSEVMRAAVFRRDAGVCRLCGRVCADIFAKWEHAYVVTGWHHKVGGSWGFPSGCISPNIHWYVCQWGHIHGFPGSHRARGDAARSQTALGPRLPLVRRN